MFFDILIKKIKKILQIKINVKSTNNGIISKIKGNPNSVQQINGDNNQVNQYYINGTQELGHEIIESLYKGVSTKTIMEIQNNQNSYITELQNTINKLIGSVENLEQTVYSADFQYINKLALVTASRENSTTLHKQLAYIITTRLKYNNDERLKVLCNFAIEIINKLTVQQIKFITFIFIITLVQVNDISADKVLTKLEKTLQSILDFDIGQVDIDYLNHLGCIRFNENMDYQHWGKFIKRYPQLANEQSDFILKIKKKLNSEVIKKILINPVGSIIGHSNYYLLGNEEINTFYENFQNIFK